MIQFPGIKKDQVQVNRPTLVNPEERQYSIGLALRALLRPAGQLPRLHRPFDF
jgi:hypothetical protein